MIHTWYIHDTYMIHTWYIHDTYMKFYVDRKCLVYWSKFRCNPTRNFWPLLLTSAVARSTLAAVVSLVVLHFSSSPPPISVVLHSLFLSTLFPHRLHLIGFSLRFLRQCANFFVASTKVILCSWGEFHSVLFSLFSRQLDVLFWVTTSRG